MIVIVDKRYWFVVGKGYLCWKSSRCTDIEPNVKNKDKQRNYNACYRCFLAFSQRIFFDYPKV